MTSSTHEVTQLLVAWSDGDEAAGDRLMPLVYDELHRLVGLAFIRDNPAHTPARSIQSQPYFQSGARSRLQ